jgi:hypothetical protein
MKKSSLVFRQLVTKVDSSNKLKWRIKSATITAMLLLCVVLNSCTHRKDTISNEKGIVVEKQYFPDTRQTVTGTGYSTSGNLVVTTHSVGEDEKYIVIFKCEHGVVFSINKSELYGKLNKGDSVIIDYYELVNNKGEVKDFDFVDASVIK